MDSTDVVRASSAGGSLPTEEFRELYRADRAEGRARTLAAYLALYPGDEVAVAKAFLELSEWAPDSHEAGRLGPYVLQRQLGEGGQAAVFLARDVRTNRDVALKIVRGRLGFDPGVRFRIKREAEALAKLTDPGVCTIYELGHYGGVLCIAMQYIDGPTLRSRLALEQRSTPESTMPTGEQWVGLDSASSETGEAAMESLKRPPPTATRDSEGIKRVAAMFESLCRSLHAAHEAGIVHRDLKPGNIMIGRDDRPIIIDFGLVQVEGLDSMTATGGMAGTPAYMSPEQIRPIDDHRIDRRSDIFSIGVILYEALTFFHPFHGATNKARSFSILEDAPTLPSRLNAAIDKDLDLIVMTALEKDPSKRYATAAAFAEDLKCFLEHRPISARPVGLAYRLSRWARRNPVIAGLTVAIVLTTTAYTIALTVKWQEATRNENKAIDNSRKYEQLAATKRIDELIEEAETTLWPAWPTKVAAMDAWISESRTEIAGRSDYSRAIDELKRAALPLDGTGAQRDEALRRERHRDLYVRIEDQRKILSEIERRRASTPDPDAELEVSYADARKALEALEGDPLLLERSYFRFSDPRESWRFDVLEQLVAKIDRLTAAVEEVRRRRDYALGPVKEAALDPRWTDVSDDLAKSPAGTMAKCLPQFELRPIHRDAKSGLWEFWHVGTGKEPVVTEGRTDISEDTALILVLLPGGSATLGARTPAFDGEEGSNISRKARADEAPVHEVELSPFFMSKFEMTQAQWLRVVGSNPSYYQRATGRWKPADLTHPVESVSWDECRRILERIGCLIPSEAQWEYGCRAGSPFDYSFGDSPDSLRGNANLADAQWRRVAGTGEIVPWDDSYPLHAPVDAFPANALGLSSMHGNVFEWCLDTYGDYSRPRRQGSMERLPLRPTNSRIYRGGSFGFDAAQARSAIRHILDRGSGTPQIGIRPARAVFR